jgi:hypothetical protein
LEGDQRGTSPRSDGTRSSRLSGEGVQSEAQEFPKELKDGLFDDYAGVVRTMEFQKRGLSHYHSLLFLKSDSLLNTPEKVDKVVYAELPSEADNSALHDIISSSMIHGPCGSFNTGAPCMKVQKYSQVRRCDKDFPKSFQENTIFREDGYPLYRRREMADMSRSGTRIRKLSVTITAGSFFSFGTENYGDIEY